MKKDIFKEVQEEWGDYLGTSKDNINKDKFEIEGYINDLLKCYKEWKGKGTNKKFQGSYQIAAKLLEKYEIPHLDEKEINEFIRDAETKEFKWSGRFISAMINELYKDRKIYLPLDKINFIGYLNKEKKIVVKGNCKDRTGENMEGGEIIVKGDCRDYAGQRMKGGKIVVKGDCKNWMGYYMEGGEIVIEGDCRELIGTGMKGGEIIVKGDCGDGIGNEMKGGKIKIYGDNFDPKKQISKYAEKGEIYHKKELVWKDGEFMGNSI